MVLGDQPVSVLLRLLIWVDFNLLGVDGSVTTCIHAGPLSYYCLALTWAQMLFVLVAKPILILDLFGHF
jgi:hypothetical protein